MENKSKRNYGGRMMTEDQITAAKARSKKWSDKNREAINSKARANSAKPEVKAKDAAYREANRERQSEYNRVYYESNKEVILERSNQYYQDNAESVKSKRYAYYKLKMKTDPTFKLTQYMRARVRNAVYNQFSSKACGTFELVGCTPLKLKGHLESQFTDGMGWENYGEWHVDHIRPCASFDLTLDSEQKICFNYTNLQPLWARDNLKKGDTYNEQE